MLENAFDTRLWLLLSFVRQYKVEKRVKRLFIHIRFRNEETIVLNVTEAFEKPKVPKISVESYSRFGNKIIINRSILNITKNPPETEIR